MVLLLKFLQFSHCTVCVPAILFEDCLESRAAGRNETTGLTTGLCLKTELCCLGTIPCPQVSLLLQAYLIGWAKLTQRSTAVTYFLFSAYLFSIACWHQKGGGTLSFIRSSYIHWTKNMRWVNRNVTMHFSECASVTVLGVLPLPHAGVV